MLVANRQNGEKLCLADKWDRNVLAACRNTEPFFCPQCGEKVVLKLGSKRIWHFAHQQGSWCESQFERESEYHLAGKLAMYRWLINQGVNPVLEKFDPLCRQKPDIAFVRKDCRYAVEFQCSPISEEIFEKRTNNYKRNGCIPLWILGGKQIKRVGATLADLNSFQFLFLKRMNTGWFLPAFCPESNQFIFLNNTVPISSRRIISGFAVFTPKQLSLRDLLAPQAKKFPLFQKWRTELTKFKTKYAAFRGTRRDLFLQELYHNRLNIFCLPPEIGLPIPSNPLIETPPLIWQSYLFFDIFQYCKPGDIVPFHNVLSTFRTRIKQRQIKLRTIPLAEGESAVRAVHEYMLLLGQTGCLMMLNQTTFKVINVFQVPGSIPEQIELEDHFYKKYGSIIENAY
ncbi:competence protein CoiA [Bacillus sp. T33-2]|uniref:competence protein CoiA n=1 Tax=Bacillus sp. T33-2 TaxID=2054168 RepID=UPI000C7642DF|nr:competence protein CoiA family protein [Bacillus sp. T33-2]PLR97604.1 competence protein CoiA [Bacillus sp. T33-2]